MGRTFAARTALALAQALTAWGMAAHVVGPGDLSPFVVGFAMAALAVTLRRSTTSRGRGLACFSAGALVAGLLLGALVESGLLLLGGAGLDALPVAELILVVASVLFALAGALYWTAKDVGAG